MRIMLIHINTPEKEIFFMNTELLLNYYESVGHERFREEVLNKQLPPEIKECFGEITGRVKMYFKLECFPVWFIIED